MSTSLAQYRLILHQWRVKYGIPPPDFAANLTKVRAICVKKGCNDDRTQRHHTGNDFWFACLLPDAFAARYLLFHKDDVAPLCEYHHKLIHRLYKKMMIQVWMERFEFDDNGEPVTKEWCEKWIVVFRARFKRWKNVRVRTHRRRRRKVRRSS